MAITAEFKDDITTKEVKDMICSAIDRMADDGAKPVLFEGMSVMNGEKYNYKITICFKKE